MARTGPEDPDFVQCATEMVVAAQAAGLQLLGAELKALARAMPGTGRRQDPPTEAEVEAGFDNMPV